MRMEDDEEQVSAYNEELLLALEKMRVGPKTDHHFEQSSETVLVMAEPVGLGAEMTIHLD